MRDPAQRRLLSALAVSVLVHAVCLSGSVPPLPLRFNAGRQAMQVVVGSAGRASDEPKKALPDKSPLRRDSARPSAAGGSSMPQDRRRTTLPRRGEDAVARVIAPPLAVHGAEAAPSSPAEGAGVSPQALRDYRIALAISARRSKHYPVPAREAGWQGTAEVAVIVSQWRPAAEVALVRSSGYEALDREALSMLQQAAGATDLPDSLRGRSFRILLPVVFSLAD